MAEKLENRKENQTDFWFWKWKNKKNKNKRKQSECGAVYLCYAAVRSHSANGLTNGVVIHEIRQNIKPVTKAQHKH